MKKTLKKVIAIGLLASTLMTTQMFAATWADNSGEQQFQIHEKD